MAMMEKVVKILEAEKNFKPPDVEKGLVNFVNTVGQRLSNHLPNVTHVSCIAIICIILDFSTVCFLQTSFLKAGFYCIYDAVTIEL